MEKLKFTYVIELSHHHKMSKHQSCLLVTAIPEYRPWVSPTAPSKVKANNKEIRCYIPKSEADESLENLCTIRTHVPFQSTFHFHHCLPFLLPRSQDRTTMKEAIYAWSLALFFGSFSYPAITSCFLCFHVSLIHTITSLCSHILHSCYNWNDSYQEDKSKRHSFYDNEI